MQTKKSIIAIDGHSSCGKSTLAKDLAKALGYVYIDTGAMYRSVTLFAMREGLIADGKIDEEELNRRLNDVIITFEYCAQEKKNETFLNGESVEEEIRGLEVSNHVSAISAIGFVRRRLVELQQAMGQQGGIVMDGRDIGTVVFPAADLKLFMTASPEIRAQRRYDELTAKGELVELEAILDNVKKRDHLDSTRVESPLVKADDAVVLDNSHLNKEEQLRWIMDVMQQRKLL